MAEHDSGSISVLVRSVLEDARELIREQIALARAELREEASAAQRAGMAFGLAAVLVVMALFLFAVALGGAVAYLVGAPNWVGYGIVALLLAGTAYVFFSRGRKGVANIRTLPNTKESLRENIAWIRSKSSTR